MAEDEDEDKEVAPHLGDGRIGGICSLHVIATIPNASYLKTDHDLPPRDYSSGLAIFEEPPSPIGRPLASGRAVAT
jgi:hypothetical protein